MAYDDMVLDDRQLLDVFDAAKCEGALVMVQAEGFDSIRFMADRLEVEGRTAPAAHAASRPELVEREATHRVIALAELVGILIMVVHVSGREAIEQIEWARRRGLTVHAETYPQYLVLTAADLDRPGMEGARFVCSPPPRDAESQATVWRALAGGAFQTFSSDHCPFRYDDAAGKTGPKARVSFRGVPNGTPGVAARLPNQFVPLGRAQTGQHLVPPTLFLLGIRDPVADRLPGRLELPGKIILITTGANQIDHLTTELR